MIEKTVAEEAFKSAEKDLKRKEIERFKEVVKVTLEKLELKKKEKQAIDREIQVLKRDIADLKAGRLDKIAERQAKDKEAEEISVFRVTEIIREKPYPVPYPSYPQTPWYTPWDITWSAGATSDILQSYAVSTCTPVKGPIDLISDNVSVSLGLSTDAKSYNGVTKINASEAKFNTPGTYVLCDGTIKNI